jgi:hypothetical protein
MTASDHVLDRRRVREVTGIFHARGALDADPDVLIESFDRAISTFSTISTRCRSGSVPST